VTFNNNGNLKQIQENAFGFLKNSTDRSSQMNEIQIHDGGLKTVPHKLLPWDKLVQISILGNPANCDARMDWLFRNPDYKIDKTPTNRYYDRAWCKFLIYATNFFYNFRRTMQARQNVNSVIFYRLIQHF
jgi:hypothetical protein